MPASGTFSIIITGTLASNSGVTTSVKYPLLSSFHALLYPDIEKAWHGGAANTRKCPAKWRFSKCAKFLSAFRPRDCRINFRCSAPDSHSAPTLHPLSWNAAATAPQPVNMSPITGVSCRSTPLVSPSGNGSLVTPFSTGSFVVSSRAVMKTKFDVLGFGMFSSGISFCNKSFILPSSSILNTPSPYFTFSSSSSCVLVMYILRSQSWPNSPSYCLATACASATLLPRPSSMSLRSPIVSSPYLSFTRATIISSRSSIASGTSLPSFGRLSFHNCCRSFLRLSSLARSGSSSFIRAMSSCCRCFSSVARFCSADLTSALHNLRLFCGSFVPFSIMAAPSNRSNLCMPSDSSPRVSSTSNP